MTFYICEKLTLKKEKKINLFLENGDVIEEEYENIIISGCFLIDSNVDLSILQIYPINESANFSITIEDKNIYVKEFYD